ncbi:MAG: serine/threonine-protein kinase [Nostocaceae cyanobacterium]|nr:serine/threonine-protein kinase [Nostocaceae cyanobacterium]
MLEKLGESPDDDRLGSRYQLQQQLGKKAGRRTFLAQDVTTGELVVVKLLSFGSDFEWNDLKLFEREAQTLKSLSHPSIPRYLDYFEVNLPDFKGFALVQTYISAPTLEQHLSQGRTFTEVEVKEIAAAVLEILIYLHGLHPPVIHRDIKPSNILLTQSSDDHVGQVYLIDFGSVQTAIASEGGTRTVVGTYGYMPPEQFGGRTVGASDLYSLGATLIYLLTGIHPADLPQKDLRIEFEQVTNLSPAFTDWLQWMSEPSLERRLPSAQEALQALQQSHIRNNSALAVGKPAGSNIQLNKNKKVLEVIIPQSGFNWSLVSTGLFAIAWNSFILFWTASVVFIPFPVNIPFLLFSLPFWGAGCSLAYTFLFPIFGRTRLRLNRSSISWRKELLGLKFNIERSSALKDIHKIVYIPKQLSTDAQLIIYSGIRKYQLGGKGSGFHSELELEWLAQELSNWLGIPITREE